jgi:hypothetical protein
MCVELNKKKHSILTHARVYINKDRGRWEFAKCFAIYREEKLNKFKLFNYDQAQRRSLRRMGKGGYVF